MTPTSSHRRMAECIKVVKRNIGEINGVNITTNLPPEDAFQLRFFNCLSKIVRGEGRKIRGEKVRLKRK